MRGLVAMVLAFAVGGPVVATAVLYAPPAREDYPGQFLTSLAFRPSVELETPSFESVADSDDKRARITRTALITVAPRTRAVDMSAYDCRIVASEEIGFSHTRLMQHCINAMNDTSSLQELIVPRRNGGGDEGWMFLLGDQGG